MNNEQYKLTVAFHGQAAIGATKFCPILQACYDDCGIAGMFQITGAKGDDLIVEFTRELSEDTEVVELNYPYFNLADALRLQLARELRDSNAPPFTLIAGPVFGAAHE